VEGTYFFIGNDHPIVRQFAPVKVYDFDGRECLCEYKKQDLLLPIWTLRKKEFRCGYRQKLIYTFKIKGE
jgi:hypothetical protein